MERITISAHYSSIKRAVMDIDTNRIHQNKKLLLRLDF